MPNHSKPGNALSNLPPNSRRTEAFGAFSAALSLENLGNPDYLPIPVWILNQQGQYVEVNPAYCSLFGFSRKELIAQHSSINIAEDVQAYFDQNINELVSGREKLTKVWEVKTKSGEIKFVLSTVVTATDRSAEPLMVFYGNDITAVKDSEAKEKALSQEFQKEINLRETAEDMLLHDVRKPVANIVSICSLILNKEYDKQKTEHWLNVLDTEARKSLKILDRKAKLKRLELKNFELELSDFNVIALIRSILVPLGPLMEKHSLQLKIYLDNRECQEKDELIMTADKFFIEIMLNNLITNAIEASPEHSPVSIYLNSEKKDELRISIHNKGEIPKEVRGRFFDKYVTFGKPKGFGIGTYTAKLIASSHKGDISFTSSKEKGTRLNIQIPVL